MKGRNPSGLGEMNEDTKNFSALVLRQRLMPEEQLEECLAYQESMSAHGLEKPVWVIALEKGYLKQENYREVVQSVRWIGIRQEDIPLLAEHFLHKLSKRTNKNIRFVSADALARRWCSARATQLSHATCRPTFAARPTPMPR